MFKIKCTCGRYVTVPQPTDRQIEAFKLVCIERLTQAKAGRRMGISGQAVSKLLKRLGAVRSDLF